MASPVSSAAVHRSNTASFLPMAMAFSIAEAYGNGQTEDIHENRTTFQFTLYDLATTKIVLTAQTKVKAGRYDYTNDQGDIISFHADADIFGKALGEGISNTAQSCHCL